jgi:phosphatidylserine decarboxylase
MRLGIVKDGWPLILGPLVVGALIGGGCQWAGWDRPAVWFYAAGVLVSAFMVYFFRDPERAVPDDPRALVAGADGLVRAVETVREDRYLKTEAVRISIFLSPFDVHVNRAPMGGRVTALAYTPGRHLLTLQNAASEYNEHSSILVEGPQTRCLVKQIVGPVVRRVVYWLSLEQTLDKGDRIGMMKFGSRLDMYFPKPDVRVVVKKGDRVRAGVTVVAMIEKEQTS